MPKEPPKYTSETSSLAEELKAKLTEYGGKLADEIAKANGRTLEIHNTTKLAYEEQLLLIGDLLEALEEGEEIVG